MPTYDYACQACDHRFELIQSFTDDPISVCPVCDEEEVKKVFAVPAIAFKGSGFYKNDSRSSSSKSDSSSSSSSSSSSKSSDSAKTSDSKASSSSTTSSSKSKDSSD